MDISRIWQDIQKQFKVCGFLEDQTAVHRKKFEFIFSQIRKSFAIIGTKIATVPNNPTNLEAIQKLQISINSLHDILSNNTLQTWTNTTIINKSNYIYKKLKKISLDIFASLKPLDIEAANCIEPESEQWDTYNITDLRAIQASFKQFLSLDKLDQEFAAKVRLRLQSVNNQLDNLPPDPEINYSPIPVHYKKWIVDYSNFEEIKEIGGGVSSVVYYGRDKRTGNEVAIKKFKFKRLNGPRLQSYQREAAVLANANHPALLHLVGVTDKIPFCIIMEWMPNHSLYHDLHSYHHLDATGRSITLYDIARGMQFLHNRQIVHRDLKSLNVLLDKDDRIRICDFGFSRHATDTTFMKHNIGTPHWMAPEVLQTNGRYTSKIDVYAFAIVAWEIAVGKVPYQGMDSNSIIHQVLNNDLRPQIPEDLNPPMRDLITMCWERDPDIRPTFDEIVKRLSTGEIVFNGCDVSEFKKYVAQTSNTSEQLKNDVKKILSDIGNNTANQIRKLQMLGLPSDIVDECWEYISKIEKQEDKVEFTTLFFATKKLPEVVKFLRSLPNGSVPPSVAVRLVEQISSIDEKTDEDIVATGCKSGCADLCAIYSKRPKNIATSLEVCASVGVDQALKAAVEDVCVSALSSNEDYLVAAGVRCLIGLDEAKRIPKSSISSMLRSGNVTLHNLALLAISLSPFLANDVIDDVFDLLSKEKLATMAIVAAAGDQTMSIPVLERIEKKTGDLEIDEIKCLLRAAKLKQSLNVIQRILSARKIPEEIDQKSQISSKLVKLFQK
ncbi:TKL family protein kinase [Trichomonas vaginalis G3]|uniref:TKL family protein kinase n=1 Tax=Trichomonas vaginalis (strain ATCC PRA-98 / G3) TaxID=412133 RepID=A2ETT9_TRIV3|nr:protein kinase protein [Trichomonas vaginalis G3]EAY03970.1 TKL family protein kinase [Trichomonas vaginalis G3]KAI5541013.1 protein kinase protein [Trichomonas vaginalis G3]|eukprot:XP_001316193.1 TKL family protein kinase [Trichomonas vaginalis G3]